MDAIKLLYERNSAAKLCDPAPSGEVLTTILKAGLRAPDHARLTPWRFLTIEGSAREQLGQLFAESAQALAASSGLATPTESELGRLSRKPLRAPLIIVVIAAVKDHPKVPPLEQVLSAGCAAHAILLAAHALGYAGIWRTGSNAYDKRVMDGLGLSRSDVIVGFIYMGTKEGRAKSLPELSIDDYHQTWAAISEVE
ncbi:MAG: nitroreductase [Oceanicoccus sp.]